VRPPVGRRPRRALGVGAGERVGVVVELASADVLVAEVAADEAVLRLAAGDPADAPERRQVEEPLVVTLRMFPDEEPGAADVVGVCEADQQPVARRVATGVRATGTCSRGRGDRAASREARRGNRGRCLILDARDLIGGEPLLRARATARSVATRRTSARGSSSSPLCEMFHKTVNNREKMTTWWSFRKRHVTLPDRGP
jgi:hypothetical protein